MIGDKKRDHHPTGLDINTVAGKESAILESQMMREIEKSWGVVVHETNKSGGKVFDGYMFRDDDLVAIYECKNRNVSYEQLKQWGSWLVTWKKLKDCQRVAKKYNVDFIGFLGVEKSDIILYWHICNKHGEFLFDFDVKETETQATINGGKATRYNAFLPLEYAKEIKKKV
jgi:hypothetical protein